MTINLDGLGPRELQSLIASAEKRLKLLSSRRPVATVRRELALLAASQGYSVEELVGAKAAKPAPKKRRGKKAPTKVAAKYRDPENQRNIWSGRGRMPVWLADRVKRGQSATDFLIPGLARPTAKKKNAVGRRTVYKAG